MIKYGSVHEAGSLDGLCAAGFHKRNTTRYEHATDPEITFSQLKIVDRNKNECCALKEIQQVSCSGIPAAKDLSGSFIVKT